MRISIDDVLSGLRLQTTRWDWTRLQDTSSDDIENWNMEERRKQVYREAMDATPTQEKLERKTKLEQRLRYGNQLRDYDMEYLNQ